MLSKKIGHKLDGYLSLLIQSSFLSSVNPNLLTLVGLSFNLLSAACILFGYWKTASILILVAGFFDILDGAIARTMKKVSHFGGFADSVIDRYSDMAILIAFILHYSLKGDFNMIILCSAAFIGIVLTPYTRARAEIFLSSCNVGIMERAERIIIISAGCYFNLMKPVFWVLAIFANITVFQRIYYTWQKSRDLQNADKKQEEET